MPHTLRTPRLLLRPPALRDGQALSRAVNDEAVLRNTGTWVYPASPEYARYRIARAAALPRDESRVFSMVLDETLVGQISLHRKAGDLFEIGYMIGCCWWGQGLATEAVKAVCAHGFRTMPIGTIFGGVFIDNVGSARVLQKLGFERRGPIRATWSVVRGQHDPGADYYLTRERMRP